MTTSNATPATARMPSWPYPRIVAHRGGGSLAPENTLAAIAGAVVLAGAAVLAATNLRRIHVRDAEQ